MPNNSQAPLSYGYSIPCTGGTPWTYINVRHPIAKIKVQQHVRQFWRLWKAFESFIELLKSETYWLAIEWPRKCRYWKFTRVANLCIEHGLTWCHFDGCAVGITNRDGIAIRKPWTVATNLDTLGRNLSKYQCTRDPEHVAGRGSSLKQTESYTYMMTDCVHRSFCEAASSQAPSCAPALQLALCAIMSIPEQIKADNDAKLVEFFMEPSHNLNVATSPQILAGLLEVLHTDDARRAVLKRLREWEKVTVAIKATSAMLAFENNELALIVARSAKQPTAAMLECGLQSGVNKSSYVKFVEFHDAIPDIMLTHMACPPGGEADLLILGDSSIALVQNAFGIEPTYLTVGDALDGVQMEGIRDVHSKMCWGKGLAHILEAADEMIPKIREEAMRAGRPVLPILVAIGWAGNDVHGDYGYQGCQWIHRWDYLRTPKDRAIAEAWPTKQLARVERSVAGAIALKAREEVLDVIFFGNNSHSDMGLPESYNIALGKHYSDLAAAEIMGLDAPYLSMNGIKYDGIYLMDVPFNRKLYVRFLSNFVKLHMNYLRVMEVAEILYPLRHRYGTDLPTQGACDEAGSVSIFQAAGVRDKACPGRLVDHNAPVLRRPGSGD